jgi:hypothetical protein
LEIWRNEEVVIYFFLYFLFDQSGEIEEMEDLEEMDEMDEMGMFLVMRCERSHTSSPTPAGRL